MGVGEEPGPEEMLSGEQAAGEVMGEEEQFLVQESVLSSILGEGELDFEPDLSEEYSVDDIVEDVELEEDESLTTGPDYEKKLSKKATQKKVSKSKFKKAPPKMVPVTENIKGYTIQLEERLQAYDHYYTTLYENHEVLNENYTKLNENYTKLNENYKNTINENKNKKETISDKAKKRFESLKKENKNSKQLISTLKEKLNEVNLSNAKLLYTNRVLNSDSLNERQKDKIVEAFSKAGTVEETKTIFETLQNAAEGASTTRKTSKSLDEAVYRNSSAFLPHREVKSSDPSLVDRMQKLAGITKF